jgi:hypothetical protein
LSVFGLDELSEFVFELLLSPFSGLSVFGLDELYEFVFELLLSPFSGLLLDM